MVSLSARIRWRLMMESMMAERQVLIVSGMVFDGCERRITSALSTAASVNEVSAPHEAGLVTLRIDAADSGTDVVRGVIENLGYEVVS